jgi:hypothetical protein
MFYRLRATALNDRNAKLCTAVCIAGGGCSLKETLLISESCVTALYMRFAFPWVRMIREEGFWKETFGLLQIARREGSRADAT